MGAGTLAGPARRVVWESVGEYEPADWLIGIALGAVGIISACTWRISEALP